MSVNITDHRARDVAAADLDRRNRDAFSTALFTGLNITVFMVLAASVVGAAVLYSQGA
jgi:hypothetical protein